MARDGNPKQSDIARLARVSQATVSLVLTGRAREQAIPVATQKRVTDAVAELGYVPNVAARSLRGGRNGLIGVYTFEPVFPVTSDDYYNEFLVGIEQQAVELSQDLVLFASTQRSDGSRRIYGNGSNRLRLADGAVLLGLQNDDEELERLAAERFPYVFIGRRDGVSARMPYVTADYAAALGGVLAQLVAVGHSRAAYLGRRERTAPHEDRLSGYLVHAAAMGVDAGAPTFADSGEVTSAWLDAVIATGATALVVESYELASAVTSVAAAAGIDIPARLSMVCLDIGPRTIAAQEWSHIQVPRRELGRRAVAVLLDLLNGTVPTDYHEAIPCLPASSATIAAPSGRQIPPALAGHPAEAGRR